MNKPVLILIVLAAGLFVPAFLNAQGTLYVSNLDQPSAGSVPVASDMWLAGVFRTGTFPGGYDLNSVQLLMNPASGSPNGFAVSIFSSVASAPGSSLGSLSGSDPAAGGFFTYTASSLRLTPSTQYWIVLAATTPLAMGSYNWSAANSANFSSRDNWALGGGFYSANNGLSWDRNSRILQFGLYATPVPEPSTLWLGLLGSGILVYARHRQIKKRSLR